MEHAWIIWISIAVALFVFEASTVTLTSIWFAVGALVTAVISYFMHNFLLQLLCFLVLSALLLVLTRPLLTGKLQKTPTNFDSMVGKQVLVVRTIDNINGGGQVKYNGTVWTARTEDDTVIQEGQQAVVQRISGVSLIVQQVTEQKG